MFDTKLPYYREIIRFCVVRFRIDAYNPNSAVVRYCDITTDNITRGFIYIYIIYYMYTLYEYRRIYTPCGIYYYNKCEQVR